MSVKVDWLGKMTESHQNQGDKAFENDRTLHKLWTISYGP